VVLVVVATAIPFLPYASRIGFVPMSGALVAVLAVITIGYVAATELVKRLFYRPAHEQRSRRERTSFAS
jgi:Mg2+-importing ATPase